MWIGSGRLPQKVTDSLSYFIIFLPDLQGHHMLSYDSNKVIVGLLEMKSCLLRTTTWEMRTYPTSKYGVMPNASTLSRTYRNFIHVDSNCQG